MYVKSATLADLPAIQQLLRLYGGTMIVGTEHFNKRDLAIQARNSDGELVGFIWCGLMAKNTVGYVDKFVVHPDYAHKKVGMLLSTELMRQGRARGVRYGFAFIKHDAYHDKSAINALRFAMGSDGVPYTLVQMDVENSYQEIQALKQGT